MSSIAAGRSPMADATTAVRYEAVIGIEIHCQLRTASKMFCGCSTEIDGAAPNTR
jgi:aspartyl-tRNA(Asn)/glutamyl-tRNA(Gln) amidotransferase subunit B